MVGDKNIANSEILSAIGFMISNREFKNAPIWADVAADSGTFPETESIWYVMNSWFTGIPVTGTLNPAPCAMKMSTLLNAGIHCPIVSSSS
jgi:hypothetical protein